ncbi:MAG TPA: tetratricopeptide repeat protein [Candidatus Polarisedimenticolaceae bacterium]|nr:tetratricopeptide repeat protein [Candidatus Polarisedimenticolaceae bacterium]
MALVLLISPALSVADSDRRETLRFAAEMAAKGNWREARFRWERASAADPGDAQLLNNLAVAAEALGEPDRARELYARAISLPHRKEADAEKISENASRSARFWKGVTPTEAASPDNGAPVPTAAPGAAPAAASEGKSRGGGDTMRLSVMLPLPARLDLSNDKTLLVASFLTRQTDLLDVGNELARFLRGEFRKKAPLQVLEVTPPPAIPEQTLDDLAANRDFWQMLGREHGADLIVSGGIRFDRRDASGFQEVEDISPITGQKIRTTRFVEQEQFTYELDILFLDGHTGALRLRDRLSRGAVFRGQANDPITAFYQLSEAVAGDVLAVVAPRTREELRVLFRG